MATQVPVALLVGLGNPGPKYESTRHNAGFWLADEVARRHGGSFRDERKFHGALTKLRVADRELLVLKPGTYMNHSGRAVQALAGFYKIPIETVLLAHDEIDLPPGTARLKQDGGHGGHNGLRDTAKAMGGTNFGRLRLGVGHPGERDQVIPYVLSKAGRDEQRAIDEATGRSADVLPDLVNGDWNRAFQSLHNYN